MTLFASGDFCYTTSEYFNIFQGTGGRCFGISLSAFESSLAASGLWCTGNSDNCNGERPSFQAFVKVWNVVIEGGQYTWSTPARLHDDEPGSDFGRSVQLGKNLLVVGAPLSSYYDAYLGDGIERPGIIYFFAPNPNCVAGSGPCWTNAGTAQAEGTLGYGQALSLGPTYLSVTLHPYIDY